MHQFRKRPISVTARQLTASSLYEVLAWVRTQGGNATEGQDATAPFLVIRTLEGNMRANLGDWIVRGVRGEFHPVRGDIFAETYEPDDQVGAAQPADRAAVYGEVAGRLAADAEQGDKEGFTRIYRRSAAKQVREWGEELRRSAAEAQPIAGPDSAEGFDYPRDPDAEKIVNTLPPEAQRSIRAQLAAESRQDGAQPKAPVDPLANEPRPDAYVYDPDADRAQR